MDFFLLVLMTRDGYMISAQYHDHDNSAYREVACCKIRLGFGEECLVQEVALWVPVLMKTRR